MKGKIRAVRKYLDECFDLWKEYHKEGSARSSEDKLNFIHYIDELIEKGAI